MYSELDVEMIIKLVIQKLYMQFGAKALLIVDEALDEQMKEQDVVRMAKAIRMPWLTIDLLYLSGIPSKMIKVLEAQDVIIHKIFDLKTFNQPNQSIDSYICLFLNELNISDSEKYANFSFQNEKDRIIYHFLKLGKTVYYQSDDLTAVSETHPTFIELQSQRIQKLETLGFELMGKKIRMIEGFCDIQRLKAFEGETVVLAQNVILSPLAKDYIKSGAITVVRK